MQAICSWYIAFYSKICSGIQILLRIDIGTFSKAARTISHPVLTEN